MDYFVKQIKDQGQKDKLPVFMWGHSMVLILIIPLVNARVVRLH
jgi:hypothetical protein